MQRINKNTPAGNLIIDGVLNSAWSDDENRYEGNLYYGLINDHNRTLLLNLFLIEQNNLCCYCLREIIAEEITIEHIIPQNVTQDQFNSYLTVVELSDTLIYKSTFDRYSQIIPPQLYPHDLGYNNLIASCGSSTHCNNKRGNRFISPFMYNEIMVSDISYEPFGGLFATTVDIEALKLDNDFLKMVRKLWFLISQEIENLEGINNTSDLQLIVDDVIPNLEDIFIETFSGVASKVSEVFKYKWFFNYYKNNN